MFVCGVVRIARALLAVLRRRRSAGLRGPRHCQQQQCVSSADVCACTATAAHPHTAVPGPLTVVRAAVVKRYFSAEGLSHVGSIGMGPLLGALSAAALALLPAAFGAPAAAAAAAASCVSAATAATHAARRGAGARARARCRLHRCRPAAATSCWGQGVRSAWVVLLACMTAGLQHTQPPLRRTQATGRRL
jgi:hypothetical protein